jgi:8-oxo-dGTP diphosphatase
LDIFEMKHLHVTCAIIERDGLVLAAQRSDKMSMPPKWEFPGGKIDPGESPEECLRRELIEELSIQVGIEKSLPVSTHQYPMFAITLHPFICSLKTKEIILHEHADLAWLPPGELYSLDWAEADLPIVDSYLLVCRGRL